jgi:nucleotide-binding universal stress UspA family protein
MYTHILIPTDGSDFSRKGVDHGLVLAKKLGSKATVLIVTEPFPIHITSADLSGMLGPHGIEKYERQQQAFAEAIFTPIRERASELGISVETVHQGDGYPGDIILKTAKERACDLIVLSSHGRRGIARLFLGSQAQQVVQNSPVPVLVVK